MENTGYKSYLKNSASRPNPANSVTSSSARPSFYGRAIFGKDLGVAADQEKLALV
jgi:hypothetical protein